MTDRADVAVVGAGPAGLGAALELKRRGLSVLTFDRGGLTDSIYRFPQGMRFFTTRERVEIGDIPFAVPDAKPTREQALAYYRGIALREGLELRLHEEVQGLEGEDGRFVLHSHSRAYGARQTQVQKVVLAVGAFGRPNALDVPGEELDKVSHYFTEAHSYTACDVAVIGGANSAAEAALDLFRAGARVTLIHRRADLHAGLKYWVGPDLKNRIAEGSIAAFLQTTVRGITPDCLVLHAAERGEFTIQNQFVLALIGYGPDPRIFEICAVPYDEDTLIPTFEPESFETPRAGVHVIGAAVSGRISGRVFIENGRHHGRKLAEYMAKQTARASL